MAFVRAERNAFKIEMQLPARFRMLTGIGKNALELESLGVLHGWQNDENLEFLWTLHKREYIIFAFRGFAHFMFFGKII